MVQAWYTMFTSPVFTYKWDDPGGGSITKYSITFYYLLQV